MTKIAINSDSTIGVGTTITGYCVRQELHGTRVVAWHNNGAELPRDSSWPSGTRQAEPAQGTIMNESLLSLLKGIEQQPQRQDATNDQLRDLADFAARLGMYDAQDVLKLLIARCLVADRKAQLHRAGGEGAKAQGQM